MKVSTGLNSSKVLINSTKPITQEDVDKMWAKIVTSVCLCNDIANTAMVDAKHILTNNGYNKRETKYYINKSFEEYNKYYAKLKYHLYNSYSLYTELTTAFDDEILKDVDKLYWSIKAIMDKYNEKDSAIKAKVELARTLIEYACWYYDKFIEKAFEIFKQDYRRIFEDIRLTNVLYWWNKVTDRVDNNTTGATIDLNKDKNCKLAFEIIERKLSNAKLLEKVGETAIKNDKLYNKQ